MASENEIQELNSNIKNAINQLDLNSIKTRLDLLNKEMEDPGFWNDNERAQIVSKEHSSLEKRIEFWNELEHKSSDLLELVRMKDDSLFSEIDDQFEDVSKAFSVAKRELQFCGQYDDSDVILSIFAGAGGTDAQDWASMLLRMYTRWAEAEKLSIKTINNSPGEEAGIKSVTIQINNGTFLYGKLKGENGVHRLVRLSPFNSDNLRQTSFARVEIVPVVKSPKDIEIDEKDLKIDVYRSGGKGGQSVNTTDSAVRITHLPTGIAVAIQNERSQLQNKETAMTILRSKLAQLQLEQHKEKISELKGPNEQAAWGNQIRNYVMHPYTMVKDTRTKHESSDVKSVLDGDINGFINAYLDSQL